MRTTKAIVLLSCLLMLAACAKTAAPNSGGSESHFLSECESTSECGSELSCIADVCTIECESDAPCIELDAQASCGAMSVCTVVASDASASDPTPTDDAAMSASSAELLGTSELLGEPPAVAFVEGTSGDEQLWVRGEGGALQRVSVWPAAAEWGEPSCSGRPSAGYVTGRGRFAKPTFDATGRYLAFVENLGCSFVGPQRIVVHELATGQSWSVASFDDMVEISAGPLSMVASAIGEDSQFLVYEVDPEALMLNRITVPAGNKLTGGTLGLVPLGSDEEVLMAVGNPVMLLNDDGAQVFEPINSLGPDLQLGDLRASPSGETLCIATRSVFEGPDSDAAQAVVINAGEASVQDIPLFPFTCVFSASGRYVTFGSAAFELVGDDVVALPPPSETILVAGAFDERFYGTSAQGDVVRVDPATGETDVVIAVDVLEGLCEGNLRQTPSTRLFLSSDGRRMGVVKHYCGDPNLDQSANLALDLATGAYETIEASGNASYNAFDVAWPSEDIVWVFSARTDQAGPSFFEIGPGPAISTQTLAALEGILHSPAVPR